MTPICETIGGQRVLFVMAVDAEYGPHLRQRFVPLMTGVGPVEAALATGIALDRMARENSLPDLVLSLGSAGADDQGQRGEGQEIGKSLGRDPTDRPQFLHPRNAGNDGQEDDRRDDHLYQFDESITQWL